MAKPEEDTCTTNHRGTMEQKQRYQSNPIWDRWSICRTSSTYFEGKTNSCRHISHRSMRDSEDLWRKTLLQLRIWPATNAGAPLFNILRWWNTTTNTQWAPTSRKFHKTIRQAHCFRCLFRCLGIGYAWSRSCNVLSYYCYRELKNAANSVWNPRSIQVPPCSSPYHPRYVALMRAQGFIKI